MLDESTTPLLLLLFDCSIFLYVVHKRSIVGGDEKFHESGEGKNMLLRMMNMKHENQIQFNYEAQQLITRRNYRKHLKKIFC
jgi:hypothetical protein